MIKMPKIWEIEAIMAQKGVKKAKIATSDNRKSTASQRF